MALTSGTKLGPYEIESPLGAGGMGEVYRARDTRLNRDVAVKILPASFSADPERLQRFAQESRAAAALNHPNILSIYDIGEANGAPYVVSELLEGETLRDRLRNGPLSSTRKAIDYAQQIARGLAAAHEKGIIHRDLKSTFPTTHLLCKSPRKPAPCWAQPVICRPSRCAARRPMRVPTFSRSEQFSTRCSRESARFMATPPPTP